MKRRIKIAFTDFWHPDSEEAIRSHNPLFRLLARHYDLELSDSPDFLLYSCFGKRYLKYACTRIFFTGENIRPDFGECDYAFSFDYPVTERNYRLPLYRTYGYFDQVLTAHQRRDDSTERGFCSFVYSNARARERVDFLRLLSRQRRVDCGGRLFNNVGGPVPDKLEFLRRYRFNIAFENASHPGYTTEKILEAFIAGAVPIYWGNPLADRDFNPRAFINCHDFDSPEAVVRHVLEVDADPALYAAYRSAPAFVDNRPNEYADEANIVQRFERIFAGPTASRVAGRLDPLRYYLHPDTYAFAGRRLRERWRGRGA